MALPPIIPAPKPSRQPTQRIALPPILPPPRKAPPPRPTPRANLSTGANPRGVAIAPQVRVPYALPPKTTVNDRAARTLATGNNPRGVAIAQRPQAPTPGDIKAVYDTFQHQDQPTQTKLVQNALKNPSPEGRILIAAIKAHVPKGSHVNLMAGTGGTIDAGPDILQAAAHIFSPSTVYGGSKGAKSGSYAQGGMLGAATPTFGTNVQTLKGAKQFLANTGKDIYTMPGNTVMGLAKVGGDLIHLRVGDAVKAFADPFIQTAEDPIGSLRRDPFNTALMFAGPEAIAGRVAGSVARTGALGERVAKLASTERAPLHLGTISGEPAPFIEKRSYSPNVFTQSIQKGREQYLRSKGQDPNIARPAPRVMPQWMQSSFNVGGVAKLQRRADELSAVRQMEGPQERSRVLNELRKAAPDKNVRNIVTHILQGIIKTPETAKADIEKEIGRLKEAGTGKRTVQGEFNRRQVRDLSEAAKHPEKLHEAFDAAAALRPQIKAQDAYLVAHGLLDPEQAARRSVLPYALAHMEAKYDPIKEVFTHKDGSPLSTKDIFDHIEGWRNVDLPNPAHAEARGARNEAQIAHNENLAKHYASTAEHTDATTEHAAARDELQAHTGGGPTVAERSLIERIQALRDRPGTPGEGAAAQGRLDAIWARIRARTGGISRDRLTAAEERLRNAVANKALTRRAASGTANDLREAERTLARTPERTTQRVYSGDVTPHPAYVGHFPGKVSPANFWKTYQLARGTLGDKHFTGGAFEKGGYDHTYEGLAGQMASRAEAVTRAGLHDRVVNELGIKMPKEMQRDLIRKVMGDARAGKRTMASAVKEAALIRQGLFTSSEAEHFARSARTEDYHNKVTNALDLTPISAHPSNALDLVRDLQNPSELGNLSSLELRALENAMEDARHGTARNVTLVPTAATDRFKEQFQRGDKTMRRLGKITQQFRGTVLPYSTHWMAQIGSEAGLRSLLTGTLSPHYLATGRRLAKELQQTPEGRSALMEMTNATFFNSAKSLNIYHERGMVGAGLHAFPPTRALIAAHHGWANFIGKAMYGFEHNARLMGLGKMSHREVSEFSRTWQNSVRIQGRAMEELTHRLTSDPALVAKFGRSIDDTFGKYNKFSPEIRAAVQSYAPFLPWYLNAAKFVLWHLPAHHPVASALLASLRQTVSQDIADGKQMPLSAWAMQALARFTPFGIFSPESTTPSLSGAAKGQDFAPGAVLFPQMQSMLYNYLGLNSFGEGPLKGPQGDVKGMSTDAIKAAGESGAEAFLPLLSRIRAAEEGGRPSYGTSNVFSPKPKPGASGGIGAIVNRIFNPVYGMERSQGVGPKYGPTAPASGGYLMDGGGASGGGGYLMGGGSGGSGGSSSGYLMP